MKGIGVSPGIVIGKVLLKEEKKIIIEKKDIINYEDEVKRYKVAMENSKSEIQDIYNNVLKSMGEKEATIFEAHLMILEDPEMLQQIEKKIQDDKVNAEWALKEISEMFIAMFDAMDNEYMKERAADIKDVTARLMKKLLNIEDVNFSQLANEVVIVARDLTPSDTSQIDKKKVLGFITEIGGRTSHSAIMARTLEIPAIVAVKDIASIVKNGDLIVFDGEEGLIYINPEEKIVKLYEEKKEEYNKSQKELDLLIGKESITTDGIKVELSANIGTPKDLESVLNNDGEGIGLYRSEFLYMDRTSAPTEQEQYEAYKEVAQKMKNKPVVIRTLDVGGDKELDYLNLPSEMNPFLGYRAIRVCLDKVDIFKTQLRAILRASAYGNIKIMFPMISSIEELRAAKAILEEVKNDLHKENIAFNEKLEVGIMIEIPAAAIISDLFAREVDFFSIGTNDLIQYTTAVDRMNEKISHLYNPFHPALLRLVKMVIDNAHKENKWVGMCGEVAGDPKLIPVLIGMGLDEFSMSPISILRARGIIRNISQEKMRDLAQQVVNLPTAEEVEKFIEKNINLKN
ncbi:phosphoenolpyruvate--protein phosphotransferase [Clostridium tagluense]|uniref:phosphoenolpyruvate--protein phosphotransferase n=1 Tax=Clostridium tagluense TaxID=360422 RepID=UPI001CF25C33|nr:phosphoenolpyruvate--protein phosphotransferase [Clostridium tagluense]MCB2313605.1 phosphoenolpyruvate--protein phosphotransferase [Clostridium tagluense]MCB2318494.1 phosphoenolpyruvate--protein phosphotransferase [Clostridium tagluense]MCB2323270.1 phosphoenolpyruvate--protein phosphotransferase [Clostridium tagluense]MCB2328213.1 phosphoenolpyruvate--protein phosphotransferase [Clostridium tagluense]MCB2332972.1 phosphoenolpyruvate--protein phosphotransferase [Clostridium tagluense]